MDVSDNEKNRKIVNSCLQDLGNVLNTELSLDEEGVCAIQHDSGLVLIIEIPTHSSLVHFYTALQPLTGNEIKDYELLEKAMLLNQFTIKTHGGTLSLTPELNSIMFSLTQTIENCEEDGFIEPFNRFITTAIELRKEFIGEFMA